MHSDRGGGTVPPYTWIERMLMPRERPNTKRVFLEQVTGWPPGGGLNPRPTKRNFCHS